MQRSSVPLPDMSSKEAMDEIEEFLLFNKGSLEKIRAGLKIVGEEEQQLLALRHQLNKVKRIREEQVKKDEQIQKLQEHINLLEYEKATALRQNSELHQIMSERIETLERHLLEKETTERIHTERLVVLEREVYEKASLEEEVAIERKKTKEALAQAEKYREEVKRVKSKSTANNQLNDHFQALFDNLRQEINTKDAIISDLKQRHDHKDNDHLELTTKLQQDLEATKDHLTRSERMNSNLSEELARRTKENDGLQKLLQETESVLNTFKATTQHEINQLRADVQSVLAENEALHQSETTAHDLCHALTRQLQAFTSLFRDHQEKFELRHLQDIFVELKRLKHSIIDPDPTESTWAPLLTSFYKLIQLVCEKRNQTLDRVKSLEGKVTSVDHVATAFHAVEEKFSSVWEDAIVADSIVEGLLEEIQQSKIPFQLPAGDAAAVDMDARREDTILSVPKVAKKMTFNQKKLSKFHSKRREKDYYELIEYVRQMVTRSKDYHAREELVVYLQQCQEELKELQARYAHDVGTLQRMSDEAYLAVKVNVVESEKQIDAIRQDCSRRYQLQSTLLRQENEQLQATVQTLHENTYSLLTFVGTLLFVSDEQQQRHRQLLSTYHHAQGMLRGYERLTRDVRALVQTVTVQDVTTAVDADNGSVSAMATVTVAAEEEEARRSRGRVTFRTAGVAVVAMVHWRKLSQATRKQRLAAAAKPSSGSTVSAGVATPPLLQSLVTVIDQLRHDAAKVTAKMLQGEAVDTTGAATAVGTSPTGDEWCRLTQRLTMALSDWGLLNHQIVATNDATIMLHQLMQRLQAKSDQQQSHDKYPTVAALRQQQQQQQQHQAHASLLRLLAKPAAPLYRHHVTLRDGDVSFFDTAASAASQLVIDYDRKELFCQRELAVLHAKAKEWQARILTLSKKLASATAAAQQQPSREAWLRQQEEIITSRLTGELRRTFELELEHAKKTAWNKGQDEERRRQAALITQLEEEVATLEERVQEMDTERRRLTVKLQKTHEILRTTASHALQDMRLSEANEAVLPPPAPPAQATTTATAAAAASDARDKSFTSQLSSSFAYSSTGSTASTTPPQRTTPTKIGASSVGASSSSAVGGTGLRRSHSFSGGVSVSSSQSTAARYQAPTAAVVSAHAQRYRYVAPDARQQTPLTTASPAPTTNGTAAEQPHVPYSLRETHGRDHNYNALEHHQHHQQQQTATSSSSSPSATNGATDTTHSAAGHAFHPTKGHDASPEMHHWTTSALWQDASFVTDPSMSAVLSEKPSESDVDSWLIKIRREDYASQNTSTVSSTAPPPPPMSSTYPSSRYGRAAGGSQTTNVGGMGSVTSTPMSKSMMDTSGDTLLGYTPEVPDYASRAAVARRQMVDQHCRSQSQSDRELQDIFQDIGRLTARLETRLSQSSPARATSVGSRSSASISGRYQYNHHK